MLAIEDKDADITHIALAWDDGPEIWRIVTLGRNIDEFNERVEYWRNKGVEGIETYQIEAMKEDKP